MDVSFLALLKSGFLPGWGIFALLLVNIIRQRAPNKVADNEAARVKQAAATTAQEISDAQWSRLQAEIARQDAKIAGYGERIEELEAEVEKCHRERDAALAEAARLSAILLARGQMRQEAAGIVAIERVEDARKRKGKPDDA